MYLFSILIIPAAILMFFEKITPKNVYQILSGLIVSLILSVIFWSLSTFYTPFSYALFAKFLYIVFKEYLALIILTFYVCFSYYKDKELQSVYFVAGFYVSITVFSVALNYNDNSLFVMFLQPIILTLYIYLYRFIRLWNFKKNDKLFKVLIVTLSPLLLILLKLFSYSLPIIAAMMIIIVSLIAVMFLNRKRMFVENV